MCGRYYIDTIDEGYAHEAIIGAKAAADKLRVEIKIKGDVFPSDIAPVIAPSSVSRRPVPFPMKWGFMHPTREKILVFNTRSETAGEKALFSASVADRRCLIPVSGYYEWKKQPAGRSGRYTFSAPEPLFLAGLYVRTPQMQLPCFSILTMDAPDPISEIHARMPVLVGYDRLEQWLSGALPIGEAATWSPAGDGLTVTGP